MTFKILFLAGLLLTLGACVMPPEQPISRNMPPEQPVSHNNPPPAQPVFRIAPAGLNPAALSGELARVAGLSGEQRRREVAGLEGERSLDDAQRFLLAALLEREDSVDALERSLKILGAFREVDARTHALLDLMKKSLRARIELRQQTQRAQALQDKLDQIKALEKSLQQRTTPPRVP